MLSRRAHASTVRSLPEYDRYTPKGSASQDETGVAGVV